ARLRAGALDARGACVVHALGNAEIRRRDQKRRHPAELGTMTKPNEKMKFAVFLMADSNYHIAGWRHPDAYVDAGSNIQRWIEFAKTLERGKLDMLFVADVIGVPGVRNPESLRYASTVDKFEPFTLLAALSSVTHRLGL